MKKATIFGAFLSALAITSCQPSKEEAPQEHTEKKIMSALDPVTSDQYFISKDSANKMISSYLESTKDIDSLTNLQSLIMDADALRAYLSDSSIRKVKIMFAHTLDYINSGHQGQPAGYKSDALTVIFAGFDNKGNYILAPGGKVPDRNSPCPNHCVSSGTAASALIQ